MAHTTYHTGAKEERKGNEPWEKAKDAGKESLTKAKEAGEQALESAKKQGEDALEKVKDAGGEVLGKAKEAVQSVGTMASETATAVGKKADDVTAAAGHGIADFGESIGKKGPQEGIAGKAVHAVGDTIAQSGKYIEEHKLSGMAQDLEGVVKNHPIPALLLVFGIGFCIGRALKA